MNYNLVKLEILNMDLSKIWISLTPFIPNLSKEDLHIFLNNNSFTEYELYNNTLVPNIPFSPYDSINIQLIKDNATSNKVDLFFCENFYHNTHKLDYKIPNNYAGNYKIKLIHVNSMDFNIQSQNITISPPIDINESDITTSGSEEYFINDTITIDVELFEVNGNHVPDGNYLIGTKISPST